MKETPDIVKELRTMEDKGLIQNIQYKNYKTIQKKNEEKTFEKDNTLIKKNRAEDILNAAADGIRIIDKNFKVKKLNKTMSQLAGIQIENGIGMKCSDMFKSKDCGTKECSLVKILKNKKSFTREEIRINTKGEEKNFLTKISPYKDNMGNIIGIIEDYRDITEIKKQEQDMQIKENAISSSINAIAITDPVGRITYVNKSLLQMWNSNDENEFIRQPIIQLWEKKGKYVEIMDAIAKKGGWIGELTAQKKDGKTFPVQLSTSTVKDKENNIISMMASFVDISKQKRIEKRLRQTKQQIQEQNIKLKKLDELKSNFLNVTSHELRTPMSAIKGYIQMMLNSKLGSTNEEQNTALNVVLRNINRLDSLIQDILDISRLESGSMKFIQKEINIEKMIREIAETMSSSAERKKIEIKTNLDEKLVNITVDDDRIKQVIINLLNNAIKYSDENSNIIIKVKNKDKENLLFEVQDFGRGIPKEKQDKIFDTFYQVDSGMDRKFGGAGLGLAICRGIVIAHGGKIWVESSERKGSSFKFTLPKESVKDIEKRFKDIDLFKIGEKELDKKNNM